MVYNSMKKIEGLIAATLTPFDDNGELNLSVIEKYAQHLQNENTKGLFVSGTTGESTLLTVEERKKLAEKWIEVGKDRWISVVSLNKSINIFYCCLKQLINNYLLILLKIIIIIIILIMII